jgi:hypothetical protein
VTDTDTRQIVDALHDLTRVTIALHGSFASKAEAIRKLHELSIPASRIASILALDLNDVTSVIARAKKAKNKGGNGHD